MKGLALVLCFLTVNTAGGNTCPLGFVQHRQSCYWFSRIAGNFAFARSVCEYLGSHLAIIEDADENTFLKEHARKEGKAVQYFLGGTDLAVEGKWEWYGRRPLIFEDWGSDEPNNKDKAEHCLTLYSKIGFQWNDENCRHDENFICESRS